MSKRSIASLERAASDLTLRCDLSSGGLLVPNQKSVRH